MSPLEKEENMKEEETDVKGDLLSLVYHKSSSNKKVVYKSFKKKSNVINRLSSMSQKLNENLYETSYMRPK